MERGESITTEAAERLIERLVKADRSPIEIADELGVPLAVLGRWAIGPGNIESLCGLAKLADIRAQLLVSNFKANAAVRLIRMATDGEADELARKACVDLLRTDLEAFESGNGEPEGVVPHREPMSEEALLRVLERMGRDPGLPRDSKVDVSPGAQGRSSDPA